MAATCQAAQPVWPCSSWHTMGSRTCMTSPTPAAERSSPSKASGSSPAASSTCVRRGSGFGAQRVRPLDAAPQSGCGVRTSGASSRTPGARRRHARLAWPGPPDSTGQLLLANHVRRSSPRSCKPRLVQGAQAAPGRRAPRGPGTHVAAPRAAPAAPAPARAPQARARRRPGCAPATLPRCPPRGRHPPTRRPRLLRWTRPSCAARGQALRECAAARRLALRPGCHHLHGPGCPHAPPHPHSPSSCHACRSRI